MEKQEDSTKTEKKEDSDISTDLSAVNNLIKTLTDTVEDIERTKDGSPKGKVRIYRTSQVIEQDGILEQAIFLFPSVVSINVGGYNYHSTSYTLTQYTESKLAKMCNGVIPLSKDPRGYTFIDRDGATFRYILSFLRTKKLKLPLEYKEFDELENEAEYYELYELVELLKKERSRYIKQNSYLRLTYSNKKQGVTLAGEVKSLVEIIPKPIPGAQLKTGEDFHFCAGEKVVQGAQMEFPLKATQVDALVQHIMDCGYVIQGSKVTFDGSNDQTWIFERRKN